MKSYTKPVYVPKKEIERLNRLLDVVYDEEDMERATREAAKNRPKNILEFFAGPDKDKNAGKGGDSGYHARNGSKKNK